MSALFIAGTGTDIGKTFIAAALARAWVAAGRRVAVSKPVLSGFQADRWQQSDSAVLLRAAGLDAGLEAIGRITPFRFAAPLSPDMAAAREGQRLLAADVLAACRRAMAAAQDAEALLLIEGAGGVMSPMAEDATGLDIAAALGLPVLLVGGSYLGAISHALTAIAALRGQGVAIRALALSESETGIGLDDTAASLQRFAPGLPVIAVPRLDGGKAQAAISRLADCLA